MKQHKVKHHINLWHLGLFIFSMFAVAAWGMSVWLYHKAQQETQEANELKQAVEQQISGAITQIDEINRKCLQMYGATQLLRVPDTSTEE